jgi:hypothetical protein
MAGAVFNLTADTSSVAAAINALPGITRRAATLMRAELRSAFRYADKGAKEMKDSVAKSYAEAAVAARRYEDEAKAAERRRTAAAKAEGGYRTSARKAEADEAIRQEQRVTTNTEREARRRQNIARNAARTVARDALARGFGAAASFGGTAHGMIQSARQSVAGGERALGNAMFQAGGNRSEVGARMAQVRAASLRTGMSVDEITQAALATQTEFSSLSGADAGDRSRKFDDFLRTVEFAANTGNNASETARLQGMLAQSGFSSGMQDTLMRFAGGAAQAGAIELGGLTREGLGSIMRRMSDATGALGAGATSEQREAAMAAAFRQQVASMEVFRGQGQTARNAGNALAAMQGALHDPSRQDKILGNITNAAGETTNPARRAQLLGLRDRLFENDPNRRGKQRLRATFNDPLQLQAALAQALGNDPTATSNILAGGGHGNPQSLLANQRILLGLLTSQDANGRSAASRVLALQGATLSQSDVNRGSDIFRNDTQAGLNREETQRNAALTDNTSAIVNLSNRIAEHSARNPLLASAASGAGAGLLGAGISAGGGAIAGRLAGALAPTVAAAGGGLLGAGMVGGTILVGTAAGLAVGEAAHRGLGRATGQRDEFIRETSVLNPDAWREVFQGITEAISGGLRDTSRIEARVRPEDAQHAAAQARQGGPSNPAR